LRRSDAAERALVVLHSLPRQGALALKPNTRIYTSVLHAFAFLRNERSVQIARDVYEELKRQGGESDRGIAFDGVVFAALLEAATANVELSCEIFSHMVELQRSGRYDVDHSDRCSDVVVKSLVLSGLSHKVAVERVNALLKSERTTSC
jgi:hypothetical protein